MTIPANARWPYQLLQPGDSFEVDDERDFNSAKSATSQFKAKNPSMVFTMRISCDRCGQRLVGKSTKQCKCRKPKRLLTITRWC